MSVISYTVGLLNFEDCRIRYDHPQQFAEVLKAWRNVHETSDTCTTCSRHLCFRIFENDDDEDAKKNFEICCGRFFYRPTSCYLVESIALKTSGYAFALPSLLRIINKHDIRTDQDFLVIPDPIYWQVAFTLVLDRIVKFVTGSPMTKKTDTVLPASKTPQFFKQMQEASLNHGSLNKRSGGKNTFFRQYAFGKRCEMSARAMIVPDSDLKPNEISVPAWMAEQFDLEGKWLLLNRMPSLQPENFVGLRVTKLWEHQCFGVPLEILEQINGDFDGDECNLYFLTNPVAQAECELLLNSERIVTGSTLDLKLNPSRLMRIVYHSLYGSASSSLQKVFPYTNPSIHTTFRMVSDLQGSKETFNCYNRMRLAYLNELQNEFAFGFSVNELMDLAKFAEEGRYDFELFSHRFESDRRRGPLWSQVFSGAKGKPFHVFLMCGSIGFTGQSSFWKGLNEEEAIPHAQASAEGLQRASNISGPGYDYAKTVNCKQSIHPDYKGRLVDGFDHLVIEKDALNATSSEKLMHPASFDRLAQMILDRKRKEPKISKHLKRRKCHFNENVVGAE